MAKMGKICEKCGNDNWHCIDNPTEFIMSCTPCGNTPDYSKWNHKVLKKQDFIDEFECPECGGLNGTLEENKTKLGVRCSNCGKLTIFINKPTEDIIDNRHVTELKNEQNKLHCPKCGSTNVVIGQRGFTLTTGFLGSNKTMNRCGHCGYKWTPGK